MNELIDRIFTILSETLPDMRIAVMIVAMMPLVETRLAIPFALRSGLSPVSSCLYAFLGSSIIVPILLLILLPLINLISRLKPFKKAGDYLISRFNKKADKLEQNGAKAYLGIFLFSALPLPLTGVWTACGLASILRLKYKNALVAIIFGNLVSSLIFTLLCVFLSSYIDTIILVITLIAIIAVIALIVKIFLHKNKPQSTLKTVG